MFRVAFESAQRQRRRAVAARDAGDEAVFRQCMAYLCIGHGAENNAAHWTEVADKWLRAPDYNQFVAED